MGLAPVLQPAGFCLDLPRQLLLQALQGLHRGSGVTAKGIGLHHAHIPLAGPVFVVEPNKGSAQERRRQGGGEHKAAVRLAQSQGLQQRRHAGAMAKAMATDACHHQHRFRAQG